MIADLTNIERRVYEQVVITFQETINRQWLANTKLDYVIDRTGEMLAFRLTKFCLGGVIEEVVHEIPYYADWWEAVKDRWAPRWLRRRWPVHWKFHRIPQRITRACPHTNIEFRTSGRQHFAFLDARSDVPHFPAHSSSK